MHAKGRSLKSKLPNRTGTNFWSTITKFVSIMFEKPSCDQKFGFDCGGKPSLGEYNVIYDFSNRENWFLCRFNPLTSNIKGQILLSCFHIFFFLYKSVGKKLLKYQENSPYLGDHILNSHDLRGWISINISRRNLMLITVRAWRVNPVSIALKKTTFYLFFFLHSCFGGPYLSSPFVFFVLGSYQLEKEQAGKRKRVRNDLSITAGVVNSKLWRQTIGEHITGSFTNDDDDDN